MAIELKLPILKGTQSAYDAIEIKNPDVIYIANDTGTMYLGTVQIGTPADTGEKTVKAITISEETFVLTITYSDGSNSKIDLPMEKAFSNVSYNNVARVVTFTRIGGETVNINLSDLVPVPVGEITGGTPDTLLPNVGALRTYVLSNINAYKEQMLAAIDNALIVGTF